MQNLSANNRVHFHLFEFFRGQFARFGNDVFRYRQFADIVQQGRGVEGLHVAGRQPEFLTHCGGVGLYPAQVRCGGIVLGIDSESQSLNGSEVKGRHFADMILLFPDPAEIGRIGAVQKVEGRPGDDDAAGSQRFVEKIGSAGNQPAYQVLGKCPQVGHFPYFPGCLAGSIRDDAGNCGGVNQVVDERRDQQRCPARGVWHVQDIRSQAETGGEYGHGHSGHAEDHLIPGRPDLHEKKALGESAGQRHNNSRSGIQLEQSRQDGHVVHGQRAHDSRQTNFEAGNRNGNRGQHAEAKIAVRIRRCSGKNVEETGCPGGHHKGPVEFRPPSH